MTADAANEETTEIVVLGPRRGTECRDASILASWPMEHAAAPCLGDVDRLARLQLAAMRMGLQVRVVRPSAPLSTLLGTVGLADLIEP